MRDCVSGCILPSAGRMVLTKRHVATSLWQRRLGRVRNVGEASNSAVTHSGAEAPASCDTPHTPPAPSA